MITLKQERAKGGGPVGLLEQELAGLRRDLRATLRAYTTRLDTELTQAAAAIAGSANVEELSRDQLHAIRELTALLRKRKLKPEKGRSKDLRKIDELVEDLRTLVPHSRDCA
jgi:hypothetical protein